jgi:hypothetical protein
VLFVRVIDIFNLINEKNMKKKTKSPLEIIPGIGPSMAADLEELGVHAVADLRGKDPQMLYDDLRMRRGGKLDRCVLYVFRCAIYYSKTKKHDVELLKWWNWKD